MDSFVAFRQTYIFEAKYPTNISSEYLNDSGSKWDQWQMVRESVQNMLDEANRMAEQNGKDHFKYFQMYLYNKDPKETPNELVIRDKGRGVDFEQIFLIGQSGKRGTHYKGQKGEGESLSFLVAVRENIEKWMFSKDWALTAEFENYGGSQYKVLVFKLYRAEKNIVGTIWRYSLTDYLKEFFQIRSDYFPELSKHALNNRNTKLDQSYKKDTKNRKLKKIIKEKSTSSQKMIITPRKDTNPRLFVRGIYVKELHSLFSYNLQDVEINRDRSMVDDLEIIDQIQLAFNSDDLNAKQAFTYWKNATGDNSSRLEYRKKLFFTNSHNFFMMRTAFYKVHGKNSCVATNSIASLDAQSLGKVVVSDLAPYARDTALGLGIDTDRSVLGYEGDILPMKKVGKKYQLLIEKLQEIGKEFGFADYPIIPINKVLNMNDENLCGFYKDGKVYILKHRFEDRLALLKTYIHECGHGETASGDGTRAFTTFFEEMLIKALTGQYDHLRNLISELENI